MLRKELTFFKTAFALLTLICVLQIATYSQMKSDSTIKEEKKVQTTITYCNLELSEGWKLANLNFTSLYSFSVNERGEVVDIKKIRDDFIGEEAVKACVSAWKISGFPDKSLFAVYFIWKHGQGWVRQEISGKGFKQVMYMDGVGVNKAADETEKKVKP